MNPALINSLISILGPALITIISQNVPALQGWVGSNSMWLAPVGMLISQLYANLSVPIHKAVGSSGSLVPPSK